MKLQETTQPSSREPIPPAFCSRDLSIGTIRLPVSMSAAVLVRPKQIELGEFPLPQPGPAQVLVKVDGCGVCASNIPPWEGRPWFQYPMQPGQLGHEGWGRIVQLGEKVTRLNTGQRVGFISNHSYAEYDVANADELVLLPPMLDSEPFLAEPLGCAYNIFARSGIVAKGTVAIVGIGFLGALLIQMAKGIGARVIALGRRPSTLELARTMGATEVVLMDEHARVIDQVKELTGGTFCDVVIEATGKQYPLDLAAELTRQRGRLIVAGYHQDGLRQINMQLWNWRGLDVINAHERDPLVCLDGMRQAVRAIESGYIDPAPLYTHRFPLSELSLALTLAAERPDGFVKALIVNS
jgi:2-desacetyl-2-hydroxyethyl bacteriochlorophyllide A dehydrogenase